MDKSLTKALPRKRPYTLIEAVFSYQVDMDNGTIKTFREYARIWGWSKNKVIGFIRNEQGTKTDQPKDTHGTVKFRFVKPRQRSKGQTKDEHRRKTGQAGDITKDPDTILNKNKSNTDFISSLKENPAYKEIDIDKELSKMDAWLSTPAGKGRKKTARFIVNWLNRIDTTVVTKQPEPSSPSVLDKIKKAQQEAREGDSEETDKYAGKTETLYND